MHPNSGGHVSIFLTLIMCFSATRSRERFKHLLSGFLSKLQRVKAVTVQGRGCLSWWKTHANMTGGSSEYSGHWSSTEDSGLEAAGWAETPGAEEIWYMKYVPYLFGFTSWWDPDLWLGLIGATTICATTHNNNSRLCLLYEWTKLINLKHAFKTCPFPCWGNTV